ncbi:MAG: Bacterial extracellular solute-binding protein family 7 [Roseomonas sp.]|nr:Bacterial extracellular solute-binding protein family 7 [Roseomonas sp.]
MIVAPRPGEGGCETIAVPYSGTVSILSRPPKPLIRRRAVWLAAAALWALLAMLPARAQQGPTRLQVVGGLADVRLYDQYERRFWRDLLPQMTEGQLEADIVPFDSSGIRGQDMLHLMRLGVVPFGTVLLSLAATDEPELAAPNLAMLAPELSTLRRVVQAYRSRLSSLLKEQYGVELLAIYAYPAQVLFCTQPFDGLEALSGRKIRVSNSSQADAMAALGAIPVVTPFASLMDEIRDGRLDCAVTGSLSGNQLGLHRLTKQIHPMAISWGLSVFGANGQAWAALEPRLQQIIRRGLGRLELEVWAAAGQDTEDGFLCNAGRPGCQTGTPGGMIWDTLSPQDETVRRQLLAQTVLPGWIERCGEECRQSWNTYLAPMTRIFLTAPEPAPPGMAAPMPQARLRQVGSEILTGSPPASITAPASSSTSSR